ncbi:MAG: FAD-binding oxidoreductase [Nitrospirales bacterium]
MPDPKFTKPWHGIPRESIDWHPTVNEDACIGCGTCVTGCGRLVYRFDYDRKLPVVADPLNCMVGCTTCANICPTHAISFPPMSMVMDLEKQPAVRHAIEDDLSARQQQLAWQDKIPHPDRLVRLVVEKIARISEKNLVVTLRSQSEADCMCQFVPGQYLELWVPESPWMSRAYSIGNAPREDGRIELQLRSVQEGRFTSWAFHHMKVGDVVTARGPLGAFRIRSPLSTPLLFVARGTGFAPIKAMIEHQLTLAPDRDIALFWGVTDTNDFYELEQISSWAASDRNFHATLTARCVASEFQAPAGVAFQAGTVYEILAASCLDLGGRDAYVAGPSKTVNAVVEALLKKGLSRERILVDSYGL